MVKRNFKYAPISGTVEEINSTLADQPGLLNKSPEDEGNSFLAYMFTSVDSPQQGWLCKIKLSEPAEVCSRKHENVQFLL